MKRVGLSTAAWSASRGGKAERHRRRIRRALGLVLLGALLVLGLRLFVLSEFRVRHHSMWPTLRGGVDQVVFNRLDDTPRRFETWAYEDPEAPGRLVVKRVVALGGEYIAIRNGDLHVGTDPLGLERVRRPKELLEACLVPVFRWPGPGRAEDVARSLISVGPGHGRLDCVPDGLRFLPVEGELVHALAGPASGNDTTIRDDHMGSDGRLRPGRHPVPDLLIAFRAAELAGPAYVEVMHALGDSDRTLSVRVSHEGLSLYRGEGTRRTLMQHWPGEIARGTVRLRTRDGRFTLGVRDAAGRESLLVDEARETASGQVDSRVEVRAGGGASRLAFLDVRRDVHYFWATSPTAGERRMTPGPYFVDHGVFLLGDNPPVSRDSRVLGPVANTALVGRALGIVWPRERIRLLD